ncbi:hypothetical protein FOL46_002757, partial [Perkinsus olseni]
LAITCEFSKTIDHEDLGRLQPGTQIQLGFGRDISAVEALAIQRLKGWSLEQCVPVGYDAHGMPIGFQVRNPNLGYARVLAAIKMLQDLLHMQLQLGWASTAKI